MANLTQTDLLAAALAAGLAPTKPQLSTSPAEKAMVSRATWKGTLSFNALTMAVKTFKATEQEEVKLNMVHACNHAEIAAAIAEGKPAPEPTYNQLKRSGMKCPVCNEEVEQVLKGYQYEEGHFAIITDEEKKACQVSHSDAMPIEKFVDVNEIDPVYFAASEYMTPDKGYEIPFAILRQAMVEQNSVAIAKTSQRGREETVVIRPYGGVDDAGMIISYLYFDNEVRGCDKWTKVNLTGQKEAALVDIATQLVASMTGTFNATEYQDLSIRQYKGLINDKILGKVPTTPVLTAPPVTDKKMDLMALLTAALSSSKKAKAEVVAA